MKRLIKKIADAMLCVYTICWCIVTRTHYKKGFRVKTGVKKSFFVKLCVAEDVLIGKKTRFMGNGAISIGDGTSIGPFSTLYATRNGGIEIGKYVNCAQNLYMIDADHDISPGFMMGRPLVSKPICIRDNIWIAYQVTILKGVTIESGSVIGACSVVTRNVFENTIVAGNPAKMIRER